MAEFSITVHDSDVPLLEQIAQHEWRAPAMQLSALVEAELAKARARANTAPHSAPRRGPARSNGAVRVEA